MFIIFIKMDKGVVIALVIGLVVLIVSIVLVIIIANSKKPPTVETKQVVTTNIIALPTFGSAGLPSMPTVQCSVPPLVKGPAPTTWWLSDLFWSSGNTVVNVFPYNVGLNKSSLSIQYPLNSSDSKYEITTTFEPDITLRMDSSPSLTYYDEFSATLLTKTYNIPLVRGSPYITVVSNGGTAIFDIITQGQVTLTNNTTYYTITVDGQRSYTYILTGASGATLQISNIDNGLKTYTLVVNINSYIRLAYVPNQQALSYLTIYWQTYPTACRIDFNFDTFSTTTDITFEWQTNMSGTGLLMLALPHQIFVNPDLVEINVRYPSIIKGPARLVRAGVWLMRLNTTTMGFFDSSVDFKLSTHYSTLASNWHADISNFVITNDTLYNLFIKQAELANLLVIGQQLTLVLDNDFTTGLTKLETSLDNVIDLLGYDSLWGGILPLNNNDNTSTQNDGLSLYSNHHYYYGALLYSLAVVGKYDNSWLTARSGFAFNIARDIGNGSTSDLFFPRWRHKDWYFGHSFATGLEPYTKNQSYLNLAINGYYSLYLLGLSLNNTSMIQIGRVLLATEILSAQVYYQDQGAELNPLFEDVSTVTSWSYLSYAYTSQTNTAVSGLCTSFSYPSLHACALYSMVNPVTSITNVAILRSWVNDIATNLTNALNAPLNDQEKATVYSLLAILDANDNIFNNVNALTNFSIGNDKTRLTWWIAYIQLLQVL